MNLNQAIRHCSTRAYRHHELNKIISVKEISAYADLTGDFNPVHVEDNVVHGTFLLGLISGVIATNYPRAKLIDLSANFKQACRAETNINIKVSMPTNPRKITLAPFVITSLEKEECIVDGNVKVLLRK